MNIAIYGAGNTGRYIYRKIQECGNVSLQVVAWIDNYYRDEALFGLPVLKEYDFLQKYSEYNVNVVLISMADRGLADRKMALLSSLPLCEILKADSNMLSAKLPVVNEKGEFRPHFTKWSEDCHKRKKPVLGYLEYQVADQCNLRCNACMHFSNLVNEEKYADIEEWKRALQQLKIIFSDILMIRLMGGEPLLNKNLPQFVEVTRDAFPWADLRVVTNGILIEKMDDELLDSMKKNRAMFDISQYPVLKYLIS